ncbi:MAG: QacE family quaternary ammonium compound efflux SMR transporter [Phenylobacterium sp.]|nr:QacE family quaternary ammonium compound efflux SMR transporter [Phenylobacterium sp.]MCA6278963.1 QacE family quaternary ammonium compound efflux SMR transporter [Phenylobacterium sp.]MCA6294691.1 QacE family quaternary ammonium compound efflux SMR transporter [Phenylobacterium sp.]
MSGYAWLAGAIATEIVSTSLLKLSEGFTRPLPGAAAIALVAMSFYCLAQAQRTIPMGIGYAIWSGVGILAITAIGWMGFRQKLDVPAILGISLILAGVLVIRLFSRAEA